MPPIQPDGLTWQPDLPDPRDLRLDHPRVREQLKTLTPAANSRHRGHQVDLREFFPAVPETAWGEASTAHACVVLVDYFRRRAEGCLTPGSTCFVHQVARLLARQHGRQHADLRTTLKAVVHFGIPPSAPTEETAESLTGEPSSFLYALADELKSLVYYRLEPVGGDGPKTLQTIKSLLDAGLPCLLGFSVPESISDDADIPWRPTFDSIRGGQVVVVAGYDDRRIRWTKGALLIRNAWGRRWGENGYGWLPYRFVERQLVGDCWSILHGRWLASAEFTRPRLEPADLPAEPS